MIVTPYNYLVSDCCSGNQYIVNMPSGALVGEMWYIQSVGGYNFCCIIEQILGLSMSGFDYIADTATLVSSDVNTCSSAPSYCCSISSPTPIYYSPELCLTFELCGTPIFLNFISASTQNYHPVYSLVNISDIGVTGMTLSYGSNGWVSSVENQNTFSITNDCSIGIISFTKNPSPLNDQPTGIWIGGGIGNIVGVSANFLEGACSANTQSTVVDLQYQTEPGCSFINENNGSVTLIATSNSGGPFTYYVDGQLKNSNVIFGLSVGSHTAQAIDSNGNISDSVSFEIINTEPVEINYSTQVNNVISNTYPVVSNLTYTSNVTYPSLPQGSQITTYLTFNPQVELIQLINNSINYTISFNVIQTFQNGTQQTIPFTLGSSLSNIVDNSPCGSIKNDNYIYTSNNQLTINRGDQLDIELTFSWSFDGTPQLTTCYDMIKLSGGFVHTNSETTNICGYLSTGFDVNYLLRIITLDIQKSVGQPVSGSVLLNSYGP
jgi:hypothetical protein